MSARLAVALAALAVAVVAAAPARAAERTVDMPGKFFEPPSLTLLAGDTVTWTNSDASAHNVAALDGSFESGNLGPGGRFSFTFQQPGRVPYRCTIHPFMSGSLDVFAFALRGPASPVAVRRRAVLRGIAPGGVRTVTIEQRRPDGSFVAVASAPVGADGAFRATVVPAGPAVYRAVAGGDPSLPLAVPVSARLRTTARRLRGGRVALRTLARPAQAGAPAALQLYSRERYRWRQVAHGRLDGRSDVTFIVTSKRRLRARVVLLRGRGGYAPAVGPVRRIAPARRRVSA
ncbi:MAG TPA: cupredoxin family copper-binding protein [Solirubrobacteraceae bacterium]|nr:cupredoxin family copper-binding protein [Solirubrobacteraceae bacterium]